jgi:uncharacterized membrane protein
MMREQVSVLYHVATQLCGRHSGEVGCTSVVFATANDCYTAQLTCMSIRCWLFYWQAHFLPLWKLSSIGGTMLYTFLRSSFLVALAILKIF